MAPKIEKLAGGFLVGEGPHWDIESQTLYLTDLKGHSIHRYDPTTKKHTKATFGEEISYNCKAIYKV